MLVRTEEIRESASILESTLMSYTKYIPLLDFERNFTVPCHLRPEVDLLHVYGLGVEGGQDVAEDDTIPEGVHKVLDPVTAVHV